MVSSVVLLKSMSSIFDGTEMNKIRLTILIPTYNGEEHLAQTVDSILPQLNNQVELLLCDDGSTDSTPQLLKSLAEKYPFLAVHTYPQNLGMDKHFIRSVKNAHGAFIWVVGQDDILRPEAVIKGLEIIDKNPNLGFIYFNFSQHNHDFTKVLGTSLLDEAAVSGKVDPGLDLVFNTPKEYFSSFNRVPYFCSSKIFRTEYWDDPEIDKFSGTHFIMPAMLLVNMRRHPSVVVTTPFVSGRVPDNKWQANGQSLFDVTTGYLEMWEIVSRDPRNPIPHSLYRKYKTDYLKKFFPLVRTTRHKGMRSSAEIKQRLRFIFGSGLIFYCYILPILSASTKTLDLMSGIWGIPKRVLSNFKKWGKRSISA